MVDETPAVAPLDTTPVRTMADVRQELDRVEREMVTLVLQAGRAEAEAADAKRELRERIDERATLIEELSELRDG